MMNRFVITPSTRNGFHLSSLRLPFLYRLISTNLIDCNDSPPVTLYQYKICPFCNKAKALLSYVGVPYEPVEVNPLTKAELKPWSGDYLKVPIIKLDDEQINGSDEIIQSLLKNPFVKKKLEEKWFRTSSTMTMERFAFSDEVKKWSRFANNELAPILYPNICRSLAESYSAFGYVNDVSSFSLTNRFLIRSIGSLAMFFAASKIKSKRKMTNEREALLFAISEWEKYGLKSGSKIFLSGLSQPNLGDIVMFGTLFSIQGLDTHTEVIEHRGGVVQKWYERMQIEVLA